MLLFCVWQEQHQWTLSVWLWWRSRQLSADWQAGVFEWKPVGMEDLSLSQRMIQHSEAEALNLQSDSSSLCVMLMKPPRSQEDSHRHGFTKFLQRESLQMWFRSPRGNKHTRCCCCLPVRQSNILSLLDGAIICTGGTPAPPGLWVTPRESLLGFMRPLSHSESMSLSHRWWKTERTPPCSRDWAEEET